MTTEDNVFVDPTSEEFPITSIDLSDSTTSKKFMVTPEHRQAYFVVEGPLTTSWQLEALMPTPDMDQLGNLIPEVWCPLYYELTPTKSSLIAVLPRGVVCRLKGVGIEAAKVHIYNI